MRIMRLLLASVIALALQSCVGHEFDPSRVGNVTAGRTTRGDIERWFGEPWSQRVLSTSPGTTATRYSYRYIPAPFDPPFDSRALDVWFDENDVVLYHEYTGSTRRRALW